MNKLRQGLRNPLTPFFVFGALTLVWHLGLVIVDADEIFYGSILGQRSLVGFLVEHYQTWSSRTVIEALFCVFSTLPRWVWRLADSAVILGLALALSRLLRGRAAPDVRENWLLAALLWLYPWWYLSTAGWVVTTLNYLWPLAGLGLGFLALDGWGGRWGAAAAVLGMVCAVNMEQTMVLAILLLACWGGWRVFHKQPLPRLFFAEAALSLAGLVYMLACPGSAMRTENEIVSYYKDFGMQSFLSKVEAGVSGALGEMFLDRNLLYALFLILLAAAVWQVSRNWLYRAAALVPLAVELSLGLLFRHYKDLVPALRDAVAAARGVGTVHVSNCNQLTAWIPFLLLCGCFALVCGCVYIALGHTPEAFAGLAVLLSGFATRAAIGFTPAAAVSGERTGFLFAMGAAVCAVLVGRRLRLDRLWQRLLAAVILLPMAGVQFISLWEI